VMMTELLIVCLLIWVPVLLYQIGQRGFVILLIWLFVAPIASNLVERPSSNPFLQISAAEEEDSKPKRRRDAYITGETTVRMRELLEPNRLIFGAYLLVFLLAALKMKKLPVPLDRTEKWMAFFSVLLVASALLQSRRTAFGLRVATDAFIVPFVAYMVARRFVTTEDRLGKLMKVMGYMGSYVVLICFIERMIHPGIIYRLSGPFDKRGALFIVIMVVFFAVFIDWVSSNSTDRKRVLPYAIQIGVLALVPVIVLFTWTRGIWLGFLLGIWSFAFLGRSMVMWRPKLLIFGLALLLLPVTVLGVQEFLGAEEVYSRVANTRTIYSRFETYRVMTGEMFRNPMFGIGLNNIRDVLFEKRHMMSSGIRSYYVSHNSYLSLLVELGVVGIVGYLGIMATIFRTGLQVFRMGKHARDRWRGIAVIAIMLAYLVPAAFDTTLYQTWVPHVYVFVYFGAIAGLYFPKPSTKATESMKPGETRASVVATP